MAGEIAEAAGLVPMDIASGEFLLRAYIKPGSDAGILRIYIEGDGFAWSTRSAPSQNPTPRDPIGLRLAALDDANAAYLARPCQYVEAGHCDRRYWTGARFAPEVVRAMDDAVSQIKRAKSAQRLILIGYSGGGAIAALVAARRKDVMQLVTVAGNLSHAAWSRHHGISALKDSLDAADYARQLSALSQIHYVGMDDAVVPPLVYHAYRSAFTPDAPIEMRAIPGLCHQCWIDKWSALLKSARFADRPGTDRTTN